MEAKTLYSQLLAVLIPIIQKSLSREKRTQIQCEDEWCTSHVQEWYSQRHVTMSVTEAKLHAAVNCAQDMLYCMHVLQSLGLTVNLPIILEFDNQGAVHLANNWSIGSRSRRIDVRQCFLWELKEEGTFVVK